MHKLAVAAIIVAIVLIVASIVKKKRVNALRVFKGFWKKPAKLKKLGGLFGASTDCKLDSPSCAITNKACEYGQICDKKYGACLGGFGGSGGQHARVAKGETGPDYNWRLIPRGDGSYYICDQKNQCLVAGMRQNDGYTYHQSTQFDVNQARWKLNPASGGDVNICSEMYPGDCIAAGEAYLDGEAYLQPPGGRDVAAWKISAGKCAA